MPKTAILIVAAGKGERAGTDLPKQYELLGGQPMLRRTVRAFDGHPVRVVIGAGQEGLAAAALEGLLELDALVKGVGGVAAGDGQVRLAFDLWLADRVAPAG